MARSRKGNQTFTGFNGASDAGLRKARLNGRPEASMAYVAVPSSPEAMRNAINDGKCPFCGNTYKNIALHTRNTHGFTADEVKEMAGIPKSQPMCSEEYSQICRERSLAISEEERAQHGERMRARKKNGPRSYSEAGMAVQKAKLGSARTPEALKRMGQTLSQRRLAEVAERDVEILHRISQGEYQKDIAADLGISLPTVKRALVRAGITHDRRADVAAKKWELLEVNPFTKEIKA